MKKQLLIASLSLLLLSLRAERPRIIGTGWSFSNVSISDIRSNVALFADTQLDGITISFRNRKYTCEDGKEVTLSGATILRAPEWRKEFFTNDVADLREIVKHPGLKESFLSCCWLPDKRDKMDWRDDDAWELAARNMGVAAWIAKQGGLKGFCIDPEYDFNLFWLQPGDADFKTTAALARKRGRRIMEEIAKEFPDVIMWSLWWHSRMSQYFHAPDPMIAAEKNGALWPAFVDGILDALPPRAIMVDGDEYCYNAMANKKDFISSAVASRILAISLVSPENRDRFRAQMKAGSGHYIDRYINPKNNFTAQTLASNLQQAINAAPDGVIWLYAEKRPFVLMQGLSEDNWISGWTNTWYDLVPGAREVIMRSKTGEEDILKKLAEMRSTGRPDNLIANGSFLTNSPPPYVVEIPAKGLTGNIHIDTTYGRSDNTSLVIEGKCNGKPRISLSGLLPGECYYVEVYIKGPKQSRHHDPLRCMWIDDGLNSYVYESSPPIVEENGIRWDQGLPPLQIGETDEEGWTRRYGCIRVPWAIGKLTMKLTLTAYHHNNDEKTFFDDVAVYRVF